MTNPIKRSLLLWLFLIVPLAGFSPGLIAQDAAGGEGGGPHGHSGDSCPGEGGVGSGGDLNLNGDGGTFGANGSWGDAGGTGGGTFWGGSIRGEHSSSMQNTVNGGNVQSSRWLGQGDGGYLQSGSPQPTNASGGFCVVYEYI